LLDLSPEMVPIRRPHFELRGRELFFLISRRAYVTLDEPEAALWGLIDGAASVARLSARLQNAEALLRRLWTMGVCELAQARFPPDRKQVLVIEPHMDDAVLSVGGLLWQQREQREFTLLSLAGRSNYTSYYDLEREYFDVDAVSALRRAETELVMRLLGGRHVALELPEAPLRCRPGTWTRAWYESHRKLIDAYVMHAPLREEVDVWSRAIEDRIASSDAEEIWLPLGVGSHADHELTRNACLAALSRMPGIEQRRALVFYQDVPYATEFPAHTDAITSAFAAAGGRLQPIAHDIGALLEAKLRLVSIYGSQFKREFMAPRVEEAAARVGAEAGGRHELCFAVSELPRALPAFVTYSGRARVERLLDPLATWCRRHREASRLRVLSIEPVARWEDVAVLLDFFPRAAVELHAPAVYAADGPRSTSSRVDLRTTSGTRPAWLARLARLVFSRPRPTLVLPGWGWDAWLPFARAAFYPSDPFFLTQMNDLALALELLRERGAGPESPRSAREAHAELSPGP
jgi:LmbE family N-acetylglucosaminyl deacetylase